MLYSQLFNGLLLEQITNQERVSLSIKHPEIAHLLHLEKLQPWGVATILSRKPELYEVVDWGILKGETKSYVLEHQPRLSILWK